MPSTTHTRLKRVRLIGAGLTVLVLAGQAAGQAGDPFKSGGGGGGGGGSQPAPGQSPPGQSSPGSSSPGQTPPAQPSPGGTVPDQRGTDARVDLRPKFRAGEQLRYVMQIDSRNRMAPVAPSRDPDQDADVTQDQRQNQRVGLLIKVVQAGDDGAKLQVVYESIRLSLDLPGGRAEFDSARPRSPQPTPGKPAPTPPAPGGPAAPPVDEDMSKLLEQLVGPMVGTTLEVTTDSSGAIRSVSGGDALSGGGAFADLLKGLTQGLPGGAGMPGGGLTGLPGMGGLGGGGAMPGGNWLSGSSGSPGLRRVGESWTNTDSLGSTPAGPMNLLTTHTLRSASGGMATVTFLGRATGTGSAAPAGTKVQVEGSQYSGQYVWDTSRGQLREMQSEMTSSTSGQVGERPVRLSSQTTVQVRRQ